MPRKATTPRRPPRRTTSGLSAPGLDPVEELYARGVTDGLPVVPPTRERVQRKPEHIRIVVAGGSAGRFSAVVAGWSFSRGSNLVMRRIR